MFLFYWEPNLKGESNLLFHRNGPTLVVAKEYDKIAAMGFACGSNKIPDAFFIAHAQIFFHTHHTCNLLYVSYTINMPEFVRKT